jgi:hypothetical protein
MGDSVTAQRFVRKNRFDVSPDMKVSGLFSFSAGPRKALRYLRRTRSSGDVAKLFVEELLLACRRNTTNPFLRAKPSMQLIVLSERDISFEIRLN